MRVLFVACAIITGCAPATIYSDLPTTEALQEEPRSRQASQVAPASGTCFAVTPNGLLVTANHVVSQAERIVVEFPGGPPITANVVQSSEVADLALLEIPESTPSWLPLAPPRKSRSGDPVFTMGFPVTQILGEEPKFTDGVISSLSGPAGEAALLQLTVPVQPGNSGGPVVNEGGQVVGVITATAAASPFFTSTGALPQNVNWAVKSDYVRPLFDPPAHSFRPSDRRSRIEQVRSSICRVSTIRNAVLALGGTWNGSVTNLVANQTVAAQITLRGSGETVSGRIVIGRPLHGSGSIKGWASGSWIAFRSKGEGFIIDWEGEITGQAIKGSYLVVNTLPQQRGTWWVRR